MPTDSTARLSARFAPPSLPLRASFAFTPPRSGALAHSARSGGVGWCRLAREGGENWAPNSNPSKFRSRTRKGVEVPSRFGSEQTVLRLVLTKLISKIANKSPMRRAGVAPSVTFASVVVAVLVAVGVAYAFMGLPGSSTTISSVASDCATEYNPPLGNYSDHSFGNGSVRVFVTNSTSKICVQIFHNYPGGNVSWSAGREIQVFMLQNDSLVAGLDITVTPAPASIYVPQNATMAWSFTISPVSGTRAIYYVGLPYWCFAGFSYAIVAVGYSPAQLRAMSPAFPGVTDLCLPEAATITLVGTTNMQEVAVK